MGYQARKTTSHAERPCTSGDHPNSEYGFRPAYRSVRPYRQETRLRPRRSVSPSIKQTGPLTLPFPYSYKTRTNAIYRPPPHLRTELLISGSDDHTLFLWSPLSSTKPIARLTGHQREVSYVSFSSDGRWAASVAWDNTVRVWEGRMGKLITTLRRHVGAVYRLAWSADSRLLTSASKDSFAVPLSWN